MRVSALSAGVQAIEGSSWQLTANLYQPEDKQSGTVLFCLPGGSATRDYFDLGTVDEFDFSFVSRMTQLGHTLIVMDHPGIATNPLPTNHPFLTPRQSASYLASACQLLLDDGRLRDKKAVGLGHSMGGMILVLMQARSNLFSQVALLGSSARGLDWGLDDHEKTYIGMPDAVEIDLEELVLRKFKAPFPMVASGPSGKSITFGGHNAELTQRLRDVSTNLFAAGGMMSMIRGSFAPEAAAIDVPMFFAFGDHDIGAPPDEVPIDFTGSPRVETHVLEDTGHNNFAFPSIADLCIKLDQWVGS
ncbi:alpha/beta fold hydrolase [Parasphingorhabdus halotolerans]|uniref:Alpha/beta hydrolase n=1 Tax=Parasphingorhabdus halotolerans TaxID=2725558 RepID=A0A6H2DK54_9SPHN|nr:alpha/beta hydrolase [Parasphingorhabdus halotolerans]QJB68770.1 alpha/beta hydrolase [Parasphingorhabdus halotolerans]